MKGKKHQSTHNLRHSILGTHSQKKAPYCLDAGDGVAGSTITASVCYPSPNPDTNRDATPRASALLVAQHTPR